jgi:hypothetical protein
VEVAIRLQFINLIVPVATLERVLAAEGGFAAFARLQQAAFGGMFWHDRYLCRVDGAMNWADVDDMVERWQAQGLQGLVGTIPHQWWKDFAIAASRRGPSFPCNWLTYDAVDNCVYLTGTDKGEVMGPKPLPD